MSTAFPVRRGWVVFFATFLLAVQVPHASIGEEPRPPKASAAGLVQQALEGECRGSSKPDRDALLAQALELDPNCAAARWQSGYVQHADQWLKFDAPRPAVDPNVWKQYLERRAAVRESAQEHFELSAWCAGHQLQPQRRAHLTRVLQLEPDHAAARAQLGFVHVDDRWVHAEESADAARRDAEARRALIKWSRVLRPIRDDFAAGDGRRRARAVEQLAKIRDVEAIPAMEIVLTSLGDSDASLAAVETIGHMTGPEAAVGLARHALYASWYPVGERAAELLRDHPENRYVPMFLSSLTTPAAETMQSRFVYNRESGALLVRYTSEQEWQDRRERSVVNVRYGVWIASPPPEWSPQAQSLSSRRPTLYNPQLQALTVQALQVQADRDLHIIRTAVTERNRSTEAMNERIYQVLKTTSGDAVPNEPSAWWDWWRARNEVFVAAQKPVNTRYDYRESTQYIEPPRPRPYVGYPSRSFASCLTAGTTVWTDAGPRAIETFRIGDRVLAQDPATGELALQVVLDTTVRPAVPLVELRFGEQTIRCTGGHPFWAVGRGWTRARELKPGMRLHCVDGPAEVTAVGEAGGEPTYNLVVDKFHSYFVGPQLVLSHDNSPQSPTYGGVPGLEE